MTATNLKLVPNDDVDQEITDMAGEIGAAKKRLLMRTVKTGGIEPPGPRRYTDISNAEYFLSDFGDDLRFCVGHDKWAIYNGKYWQIDNEYFVMEYARDFVKTELESAISDPNNKARTANAMRLNMETGFNAMLKQAKYQRATPIAMFDGEDTHYLLNCNNGTLDLKSGELRPHDRANLITRAINADYDEKAVCPHFDKFLSEIQPDPEIRGFLQRSIGYSLIGAVPEHAFWILYGVGNNGKSVFTTLFTNLLGPYASGMSADTLMDMKRAGGSANSDIARLKGKRYVLVSESNEGERLNTAQIKALSAGDVVTARHLFKEFFDFAFTGKMWIATNHKPVITDHSKGLWRRVKLVPFSQNIEDDRVIKQEVLHSLFMSERSGILNWAVRGCREYLEKDSLAVPDVIKEEIAKYKFEQDSIDQFLKECCQTVEQGRDIAEESGRYFVLDGFEVNNSDLYAAYVKYCKENGEYPRKHRVFTQNLQERGFVQGRSHTSRFW